MTLPRTHADIVADAISEHRLRCCVTRDVAAALADDLAEIFGMNFEFDDRSARAVDNGDDDIFDRFQRCDLHSSILWPISFPDD